MLGLCAIFLMMGAVLFVLHTKAESKGEIALARILFNTSLLTVATASFLFFLLNGVPF